MWGPESGKYAGHRAAGMGVAGAAAKTKRVIMPVMYEFLNETSNQVRRNLQGSTIDI